MTSTVEVLQKARALMKAPLSIGACKVIEGRDVDGRSFWQVRHPAQFDPISQHKTEAAAILAARAYSPDDTETGVQS
jgi:hypothetical protein